MNTLLAKIRGDYSRYTIALLAVVFFFIYSFLVFQNPDHTYTWPDETANYYFISEFVENSRLSVPVPENEIAQNIIHPRSINVFQGNLVPGTFLGFILLLGVIGKILGLWSVVFITPLLAALSGFVLYKLFGKVFGKEIGFVSAVLYFILPPLWYYANFTMLPNIAFVSFVIFGIYGLVQALDSKRRLLLFFLSGLSIGIAAAIRTNEIIWIVLLLGILLCVGRKRISVKDLLSFTAGGVMPFIPVLYLNGILYGGIFKTGYQELNSSQDIVSGLSPEFERGDGLWGTLKVFIAPFGFHPKPILLNAFNYIISLFWWLFISAIIGFVLYLRKFREEKYGAYLLTVFLVSGFLLYYYGSWVFADQLTLRLSNIGISYVRYWLPIYILSLPFVALAIQKAALGYRRTKLVRAGLILIFGLLSVNVVYLQGNDNLFKITEAYTEYEIVREKVLPQVPEKGIIVTERGDKIFFPDRQVIGKWTKEDLDSFVALLEAEVPLYFYGREQEKDIEYLNTRVFEGQPLQIVNGKEIIEAARLHDIVLWEQ